MERTVAKSETRAPASRRAAKPLPDTVAPLGAMHNQLGNAAVAGMLRTGALQRKRTVSTPDDPWEREAARVAAAVSAGSTASVSPHPNPTDLQRACACGGTCETCEEEEVFRSADEGSTVAPDADRRVDAMLRSSGRPLDPETRSHFEPLFGHDFGDVRIHTDEPAHASATSLGAEAYTIGTDIAFAANRFDGETTAGRRLLAHELTHVVQQQPRIGRVERIHRQPTPGAAGSVDAQYTNETKDQFAGRVRQRASTRLTQNIGVLDEWKTYINSMEGFQLRAQLLTGVVMEHAIAAAPFPRQRQRFETEMGTLNAFERNYEGAMLDVDASYRERANGFMAMLSSKAVHGHWTTPSIADRMRVQAGEIREEDLPPSVYVPPDPRYRRYAGTIERFESGESGGCQTCHEINYFWQQTAEEYGTPLPTGDFRNQFAFEGPSSGPLTSLDAQERALLSSWIDSLNPAQAGSVVFPPPTATATGTATPTVAPQFPLSTPVEEPNPFVPLGPLPVGVDIPAPRTDLCGSLPSAEDSQRTPNLASWGPNSAVAARVIERIDAVLLPLGPRGYRVLGRQNFDALYRVSPDNMLGVRDGIISRITTKQAGYRTLQADIEAGGVPYEELCPIVDELLPSTNDFVESLVLQDVRRWQQRERLLQILELALLALTIIFPPSAAVTLPAGVLLGLARISLGMDQRRQGPQWVQGSGAGLYSRSQEAEAPGLADRGRNNIIFGAISMGLSGFSLGKLVAQARADARLLQALEEGCIIRHTQYPEYMLLARNGRLVLMHESGEVLGYGVIANGQLSWTQLSSPFNPFTHAGSASSAATGTSIVPYGSTGIVPFGQTGIVPFGSTPFGGGSPLVPFGQSSLALPTAGGPLMTPLGTPLLGPGYQPLLLGPGHQPLLLGPGPTVSALDPGGRGLYAMSEMQIARLPNPADAARLRLLQSRTPGSLEELQELVALRTRAAGTELNPIAGTPEHMRDAWIEYVNSPRPEKWTFQRWAATHPSRMSNSLSGVAREEQYRLALARAGVTSRSAVIRTPRGQARQIDVLIEGRLGQPRNLLQIKGGKESLTTADRASGGASRGSSSLSNEEALDVDAELHTLLGDRVTWVFEKRPSGNLVARARAQEVDVIIRVDNAAGRADMIQLMRRAGMSQAEIDSVTIVEGTLDDVVAFVAQRFGAR